jgi:hypothetical protein
LDHPGKSIVYTDVFPDLVDRLQESFRIEQKKVIVNISKNLVFFEAEHAQRDSNMGTPLSEDNRKQIKMVLSNLDKKFGYTEDAAMNLMKFLIKEKY